MPQECRRVKSWALHCRCLPLTRCLNERLPPGCPLTRCLNERLPPGCPPSHPLPERGGAAAWMHQRGGAGDRAVRRRRGVRHHRRRQHRRHRRRGALRARAAYGVFRKII
eukprot:gene16667-biopygen18808